MPPVSLHYDNASIEQGEYFDLGSTFRPISSASSAAQTWVNRGLLWSYAFNHEEAVRCFERATNEDAHCAMALWGIAYSLGPNYNKPWEVFDDDERDSNLKRARRALDAAVKIDQDGVEGALVKALQKRYSSQVAGNAEEAYAKWNGDYAEAMEGVYLAYGNDLDVAALYADALMNLTPWALWDIRTGEATSGSRTLEAKAVLDKAIAQPHGAEHPGLLHLYIHLMEMSGSPESALPVADRLRGLVPDAGHLHHMPTHLDVLCGDWKRAISSNSDAIKADERYLAKAGALNFYSLYRSHNYHFRIYAAMFAGQYKVALETVQMLEDSLPEKALRVESPPMADWLESFLAIRVHVLVRFGKWEELMALELPGDSDLYCVTTAMMHYGKGVALAATGQVVAAEGQMARFQEAVLKVPASRTLFNNTAKDILAVANSMLEGELKYRRGNVDIGFEELRKAIQLSDDLPYDEPWGWMQPPRHAIGALLLEQDRIDEAAAVYKADLGLDETLPRALRHPNNIWALHGYHECLLRLNRESDAATVGKQLSALKAEADVSVNSSCFCRRQVSKSA